jgi:transposase InsO family protein
MGIKEVVTAARSPWQNAYVERIIGSVRRECLDHVIIFGERHLRGVLSSYFQYYHKTRTHLALDKVSGEPPDTSSGSRSLSRASPSIWPRADSARYSEHFGRASCQLPNMKISIPQQWR